MKVLLTGSDGQIGTALQKKLTAESWDFIALSHLQFDITDETHVKMQIEKYRPAIVINTAAYTSVDGAEKDPCTAFRTNQIGAENIARAARAVGAIFFHLSTDYVFAGDGKGNYRETDLPHPKSIYGKSKLAGEVGIQNIIEKHIILRTAWVFGPHGKNFISRLLASGDTPPTISVACDQYGTPTYVDDLATAMIAIANAYRKKQEINWGVYHYTGAPATSRFDMAIYTLSHFNRKGAFKSGKPTLVPVESSQFSGSDIRPSNSSLDCTKIYTHFGIEPSDWRKAIRNLSIQAVIK